ncbi:MAG: MCE family protein [Deltaproteobacteria bacterium]|nr:MCE family protein [Deltaproteobacteria bacterium]
MSTEAHKFKVGLFVIGGTLILVGALIWLGASKFLSETRLYVTYFDETVQGLEVGSPVKFMGVVVGAVKDIKVAPDGRMIEVVMETDKTMQAEPDMRAQLAMAGITGMKFVEITRAPESAPIAIDFKPTHEYLPARASSTAELFAAVQNVYEKVMGVDFEGISDEVKGSFMSISGRMNDPKIDRLLEALAGTAERVRYLAEKKETENSIDEMEQALGQLRLLVQSLTKQIEAVNLAQTFEGVDLAVSNLNNIIDRMDNEMAAVLINLRRTTDNLARITEKISEDPAQTLLSEPPPERVVSPRGLADEEKPQ